MVYLNIQIFLKSTNHTYNSKQLLKKDWLIVFNLLTDLNKKGYDIPKGINPELGLIRSSISSYKKDPSHPDLINSLAKAEMSLNSIQETLLELASQEGEEYVDKWLGLFKDAMHGKEVFEFPKSRSTFIVNTPPGLTTGSSNFSAISVL